LKVKKLKEVPSSLRKLIEDHKAYDISIYDITVPKNNERPKASIAISVQEIYKRRKDPFPSTVAIREDHLIRFVDSKYYLSVYPTKS
jgi:hypothetical protein